MGKLQNEEQSSKETIKINLAMPCHHSTKTEVDAERHTILQILLGTRSNQKRLAEHGVFPAEAQALCCNDERGAIDLEGVLLSGLTLLASKRVLCLS